jgi:membrane protease YdiL (CAAX protease family)
MSWIFKDNPSPPDSKTARKRALLLSLPFALMGLFALVLLLHDGLGGGLNRQKAIQLLSVVIVGLGFPVLIFGITAKKNALTAAKFNPPDSEGPGQPWLNRADWAAGRIKSLGLADARSSIIMGLAFCIIGVLIACLVIPKELSRGDYAALLVLVFPLAGMAIFTSMVRKNLAHRYYGDCFFEMAAIPGALGGTLAGRIQTLDRLKLEQGLRLQLACIRRIQSGRNSTEKILWQDEKIFKTGADLPETGPGRAGIAVCFDLPPNQPASSAGGKEAIIWRLEARAKMAGPDFCPAFEVPVFKIAGSTPAPAVPKPA